MPDNVASVAREPRTTPCLICGGTSFSLLFKGTVINGYVLTHCQRCGMVQAQATAGPPSNVYGDYLLTDEDIERRVGFMKRSMRSAFALLRQSSGLPRILDFGSSAGYLCRAAQESGLDAWGVEFSDELRRFSVDRVGFTRTYKSLGEISGTFRAVFMTDVIEHIAPPESRRLIARLVDMIEPGGFLIGNTPNICSANIRLLGIRDPVIAPPSHVCYFSPKTLNEYLSSFGLTKRWLYTAGLSWHGFLRRHERALAFLHKSLRGAPWYQWPLLAGVKISFSLMGQMLRPFGLGYQIYFVYQRRLNAGRPWDSV